MMRRCREPNCKDYANYGARGIAVCDRWLSFESFFADMGERPAGMTLDRCDNNGSYEPNNCRWATPTQQNRNSRHCKLTAVLVCEIKDRIASGQSNRTIALAYDVTPELIHAIRRGRVWCDVPSSLAA